MQRQTLTCVHKQVLKPILRGGLRLIAGLWKLGWKGTSVLAKLFAAQWAKSPARAVAGAGLVLLVGYGLYWSLPRGRDAGEAPWVSQRPAQSF